jgi:hypothetical protein
MIYSDILEFHKRAIRFFSERGRANHRSLLGGPPLLIRGCTVWRQVFRSMWKDFKTRFQHILDDLRRHRELIESQANLLHIQQYQRDRVKTLDQLDRLEETEGQKRYVAVMEWVLGGQTKLDHDSACDARSEYPGSGRWLLKNPELENWKEADTPVSSILWLNGIPGAGTLTLLLE